MILTKMLPVLLSLVVLFAAGCATTKYHWGNYEDALYRQCKNPADQQQLADSLAAIIADGEQTGTVPPGIYAEYGYHLYTEGKSQDAIVYFEKEKKTWPEAGILMDKMIENAKASASKKSPQGVDPKSGGTAK